MSNSERNHTFGRAIFILRQALCYVEALLMAQHRQLSLIALLNNKMMQNCRLVLETVRATTSESHSNLKEPWTRMLATINK